MLKFIGGNAVTIAVSLSFFTFGFILGADVFQLTFKQIVTALISGAVCAGTILAVEYYRSKKQLSVVRERLAA
jgi:predicted branched-subunit amino acid permease